MWELRRWQNDHGKSGLKSQIELSNWSCLVLSDGGSTWPLAGVRLPNIGRQTPCTKSPPLPRVKCIFLCIKYTLQYMWIIPKYITYSTPTPKLGEEKFVSKQPACLGSWFQGDRVVPEKNHLIQKTYQVWHKPYLILAHTNVQLNSSHSCSQTRDCCFSCVFASHLIPFWMSTLWRWPSWRMNSPLMMLQGN